MRPRTTDQSRKTSERTTIVAKGATGSDDAEEPMLDVKTVARSLQCWHATGLPAAAIGKTRSAQDRRTVAGKTKRFAEIH